MYGWILYFVVVLVASLVVGRHLGRFRESCTEMTGMMAGMTIGMLGGFALGYGMTAAAGRDLFLGNLTGVLLGAALGGWFGRTGGLMGIMDGSMGGVMGGSMGAMIAAMVFPDWALNWTGVLFGSIYVVGCAALVALIESRAPEHEAMHWLLPKLALVRREPRRVSASEKGRRARKAAGQRTLTAIAADRSSTSATSTRVATARVAAATARATSVATASDMAKAAVAPAMQDYYALFGVSRDASLDRIEDAYLDLLAGTDVDKAKRADKALTILSDPERRAMYDAALAESLRRQPEPVAATAAPKAEGRGECCPPPKKKITTVTAVSSTEVPSPIKATPTTAAQLTGQLVARSAGTPVVRSVPRVASAQKVAQRHGARLRRVPCIAPEPKVVAASKSAPAAASAPPQTSRLAPTPIPITRATSATPAASTASIPPGTQIARTASGPSHAPGAVAATSTAQVTSLAPAAPAANSAQPKSTGRRGRRGKHGHRGSQVAQNSQTGRGPQGAKSTPRPLVPPSKPGKQVSTPAQINPTASRAQGHAFAPAARGGKGSGSSGRGYSSGYGNSRSNSRRGAQYAPGLSLARRVAIGLAASMAALLFFLVVMLISSQGSRVSAQVPDYVNQSPAGAAYHVGNAVPSQAQLEVQAVAATVGGDGVQTADLVLDQATSSYRPAAIKVKKGVPVRLNVAVEGSSRDCRSVVRLPALGAQALTQPGQAVPMNFTPSQAGVYEFNCPMQMMNPSYLVVTN